mgnify:CR=1 FL=1
MSLCANPPKNPVYTVTRLFRNKPPLHYIFSGDTKVKKEFKKGKVIKVPHRIR